MVDRWVRVLPGVPQIKQGAALGSGEGRTPFQGRGWSPAPYLGCHPGVRWLAGRPS